MADGFEITRERLAAAGREVRVVLPGEVAFNLGKVLKTLPKVLGRLGCPACCSGFDIRFTMERDFAINPKSLEPNPLGG